VSTERALCYSLLRVSPEGGEILAYLGGVVSVFSRPAPDTWDVPLEHSRAVCLSVTIITHFGHPDRAPPFSRRRSLSTTLNALSDNAPTAGFSLASLISFPTCFSTSKRVERKTRNALYVFKAL